LRHTSGHTDKQSHADRNIGLLRIHNHWIVSGIMRTFVNVCRDGWQRVRARAPQEIQAEFLRLHFAVLRRTRRRRSGTVYSQELSSDVVNADALDSAVFCTRVHSFYRLNYHLAIRFMQSTATTKERTNYCQHLNIVHTVDVKGARRHSAIKTETENVTEFSSQLALFRINKMLTLLKRRPAKSRFWVKVLEGSRPTLIFGDTRIPSQQCRMSRTKLCAKTSSICSAVFVPCRSL